MITHVMLAMAVGLLAAPITSAQSARCRSCEPDEVRAAYRRTIAEELGRVRAEIARIRAARRAESDPEGAVAQALREVEEHLKESESHLRMMMSEHPDMVELNAAPRPEPAPRTKAFVAGQAPQGYLGVSLSGMSRTERRNAGVVHVYTDYPVLVSVEPGSPAAEAGLIAGDVLLAYNGEDVRSAGIAPGKLRPGMQLPVRIRRGSAIKDIVVTVEQRPRRFVRVWPDVTVSLNPEFGVPAIVQPPHPPRGPRTPRAPAMTGAPEGMPGEAFTLPLVEAGPFEGMFGISPILGAELTHMAEELREVFNVDRGVLVLNVAAGTPAERAGLRGGDVIVAADDQPISSPVELQRAMQRAMKPELRLEIVRKQKKEQVKRTVTLGW
jgi:membrane-associated protease RseP (regulator of RpoE activity)